MFREPPSSAGVQVVVPDAVAAGGRVNEPVVTRVDRDVTYLPVLREKHQITDLE